MCLELQSAGVLAHRPADVISEPAFGCGVDVFRDGYALASGRFAVDVVDLVGDVELGDDAVDLAGLAQLLPPFRMAAR